MIKQVYDTIMTSISIDDIPSPTTSNPMAKPFGVSFEFLRRFMTFKQLAPTDKRMSGGQENSILNLIRNDKGKYWNNMRQKYHQLPSPLEDHLELAEIKALCKELFVFPEGNVLSDVMEEKKRHVKALNKPATSY